MVLTTDRPGLTPGNWNRFGYPLNVACSTCQDVRDASIPLEVGKPLRPTIPGRGCKPCQHSDKEGRIGIEKN